MNLLDILGTIISSVPEAIDLYHKVVPHLSQNADIHPDQIEEINQLSSIASAAVAQSHDAIATLVNTHGK